MRITVTSLFMLILVSCNQLETGVPLQSQLVGGNEIKNATQFPSTILIKDNCTAAKVARRKFLTAAHCFIDDNGSIEPQFEKGSTIQIKTHYQENWQEVTIKRIKLSPTYMEKVSELLNEGEAHFTASFWTSDIALLTIKEETNQIPIAKVSFQKVPDKSTVTIGGYGCEEGLAKYDGDLSLRRYKTHPVETLEADYLAPPYPKRHLEVYNANLLTAGRKLQPNSASLCRGDSGGPVYYKMAGEYQIVGVNSYYFMVDGSGITLLNIHARLSSPTIKYWLAFLIKF